MKFAEKFDFMPKSNFSSDLGESDVGILYILLLKKNPTQFTFCL